LRNNSGGNSAILNPFLEKLKKNYLNKKGSLYVLIGKNTFSSALMNAVDLKRNYKSILVGQTTSGNVNHYGETRGFRLPNSKIIVGYSTKYWEIWKGYNGALRPDIEIKYSLKNFKNNIDEAIEYVTNRK
jgi:C-terminal processing protease CtpA/Prc